MFAMRNNSFFPNALITNKADYQETGRQSGESPSAHSVHCIELLRSDLPPLLFINQIIMRNNEQSRAMAKNEQFSNGVDLVILKSIEEFYDIASPSTFIQLNNDLLQAYLEIGLSENVGFHPQHIRQTVYLLNQQNRFLAELSASFEKLNSHSNLKKLRSC